MGIRSIDNLLNADVVLLVEGDDDRIALRAILATHYPKLNKALSEGSLIIDPLDGASGLGTKASLYKAILCEPHCFLDDDQEGRVALARARKAGYIGDKDYRLTVFPGKDESEFEDFLEPSLVQDIVLDHYGVDLEHVKPRSRKKKWSGRMAEIFAKAGKQFDDFEKQRLKFYLAKAVERDPINSLSSHAEPIIEELANDLQTKLDRG